MAPEWKFTLDSSGTLTYEQNDPYWVEYAGGVPQHGLPNYHKNVMPSHFGPARTIPPGNVQKIYIEGLWWSHQILQPTFNQFPAPLITEVTDSDMLITLRVKDPTTGEILYEIQDMLLERGKSLSEGDDYTFTSLYEAEYVYFNAVQTDQILTQNRISIILDLTELTQADLLVFSGLEDFEIGLKTVDDIWEDYYVSGMDENWHRQFGITRLDFETAAFEDPLTEDHPKYEIRWIPEASGQLRNLQLYIPELDSYDMDVMSPSLKIINAFVEESQGTVFPNIRASDCKWEAITDGMGAKTGWYNITQLGDPWVRELNSYRLIITAPNGIDLTIPYMWALNTWTTDPENPTAPTAGESEEAAYGPTLLSNFESALGRWAMPIMKTSVYQSAGIAVPTETYGEHIWEGVLDEYTPSYGVLVQAVRQQYERLTLDYARFGENWEGLTVPVSFQSNDQGGGIFSYVLSQPITPQHFNLSLLTTYLLMNNKAGGLTGYTTGKYDVFVGAERDVRAYDYLEYDKLGWFGMMEFGLSSIDGDVYDSTTKQWTQYDPGLDLGGKYGADWYDVAYNDEVWYQAGTDFAAELLLRMPTKAPWEWEMPDEQGVCSRYPAVVLDKLKVNLKVTEALYNYLESKGDYHIWTYVQLRTMTGVWSNSSVSIDLTNKQSQSISVEIDVGDIRLWDGYRYIHDQNYRDGLITAPTLIVQIFDADPSRYVVDTGERFFDVVESDRISELTSTQLLRRVKDQSSLNAFMYAHLLDAEIIGMNVKMDQEYQEAYDRERAAYSHHEEGAMEEMKALRIIFTVFNILLAVVELAATEGLAAPVVAVQIVFAVDQIQQIFTGQSIFSALLAPIFVGIGAWIHGWTPEQVAVNQKQFTIFAPFTFKNDAWHQFCNAFASVVVMIVIRKVLFKGFTRLFKGLIAEKTISEYANIQRRTGRWTPEQYATAKVLTDEGLFNKVVNKLAGIIPKDELESLKGLVPSMASALARGSLEEVLKVLQSGIKMLSRYQSSFASIAMGAMKDLGMGIPGVAWWYALAYCSRGIVAGFVTPTEWVEVIGFAAQHGVIWGFQNAVLAWLWNYGDNLLQSIFKDDTTVGMFRAFGAALKGDFSYFQYFSTPEHILNVLTNLASHSAFNTPIF